MLAAAVTAGVTPSAVRMPPAEILAAAVEALRRMPAAAHVEAAWATAANAVWRVPAAKQMEATRVRCFSGGTRKVPARENPGRSPPEFAALKT